MELPKHFVSRMQSQLGNQTSDFLDALACPAPTSLRLHPKKGKGRFETAEQIGWCPLGRYLSERPVFAADPVIFAGGYYVQEASSMFLWQVLSHSLGDRKQITALDLCAAPGGKSTLISSYLGEEGFLVANELTTKRIGALIENFVRWGTQNQIVTQNSAQDFSQLTGLFDLVVVDAPCSGEGMFRKDQEIRGLWSPQIVISSARTQREILEQVLPSLRQDGILVYSTCTFSLDENENNVAWLVEKFGLESIRIPLEPEWGVTETATEVAHTTVWGYRFYPHLIRGEGLFMACLRKTQFQPQKVPKRRYSEWTPVSTKTLESLSMIDEGSFSLWEGKIVALPAKAQIFSGLLNCKAVGLEVGQIKGKDVLPSHALAMSDFVSGQVARKDLSLALALDYLRKKEIPVELFDFQGWGLVAYDGLHLGWVKVLPQRVNNYYPTEYRLKKEF